MSVNLKFIIPEVQDLWEERVNGVSIQIQYNSRANFQVVYVSQVILRLLSTGAHWPLRAIEHRIMLEPVNLVGLGHFNVYEAKSFLCAIQVAETSYTSESKLSLTNKGAPFIDLLYDRRLDKVEPALLHALSKANHFKSPQDIVTQLADDLEVTESIIWDAYYLLVGRKMVPNLVAF